ncbi:MAG: AEC family transporter [Verrucomicrobiales bacterium]|nr:AEC family transporter [Verrucomicrobiales bacterium]
MPSYFTILSATLPVFLVMGIGFGFHRRGWLGEEVEVGVMKLGLNLLFPCFILTLVPGNPALKTLPPAIWAIGLGFVLVVTGIAVAWVVAKAGRIKKGHGLRTFAISAGIQNYGFLTLPIVVGLFPDNPGPAGLVFVHGIGVEIAMWTVGLSVMSGKAGFKSIINGPFVAVTLALILNYTGLFRFIPGIAATTMEMLGRCAVPMAIFMIGATIGRYFKRGIFHDAFRVAALSVIVRLGIVSCVILAAAKFLPAPPDLQRLLVVQAAMPAAVFPIVLARLFGGQPQVAIQVVLSTSLVGIVTAPLVIAWGLAWVNP